MSDTPPPSELPVSDAEHVTRMHHDVDAYVAHASTSGVTDHPTVPRSSDALLEGQVYPFIIAIVPAHNEAQRIGATIDSLRSQTRPPDEIIVIADACTDETAAAAALGASVVETHDNNDKKAGALNQVLAELLPLLDETDAILVMDADTMVSENFIRAALKALFTPVPHRKPVGGVGGIFLSLADKWSVAVQLQTNEYIRYQRRLARRHGRALVLTGTGTLFNIAALRDVVRARNEGRLPDEGASHFIYDVGSLTEDNELTLCVKELGYRVLSPKECTVRTAIMPTMLSLYRQRRRWQRGALENIYAHHLNRHTTPYFLRQLLTYLGVVFSFLYAITLSVSLWRGYSIPWLSRLWVSVFVVYLFEQTWSVRKGGWRAILFSLAVIPEILYNLFLNYVYIVSLEGVIYGSTETWGRIRDESQLNAKLAHQQELSGNRKKVDIRLRRGARYFEFGIEVGKDLFGATLLSIPFFDTALAWHLVTVYVLTGFGATIARLIPVTTR